MDFSTLDFIVFALYALIILSIGLFVSRQKKGETKSAEDYFLAGKSLPWWAIGASLIAANISAASSAALATSFPDAPSSAAARATAATADPTAKAGGIDGDAFILIVDSSFCLV